MLVKCGDFKRGLEALESNKKEGIKITKVTEGENFLFETVNVSFKPFSFSIIMSEVVYFGNEPEILDKGSERMDITSPEKEYPYIAMEKRKYVIKLKKGSVLQVVHYNDTRQYAQLQRGGKKLIYPPEYQYFVCS